MVGGRCVVEPAKAGSTNDFAVLPAENRCIFFRKVIRSRLKGIRSLEQRAVGGPRNVNTYDTILAISVTPNGTASESAAAAVKSAAPAAVRSGRELSDAAHAAMRRWAKATDQEADAAARVLLGIYREIQEDTRMARSQRESLRLTVRARLDQLCTQISKRVAKEKASAKPSSDRKSVAANADQPRCAALAQIGLPPAVVRAVERVAARPARTPMPTTASSLFDLIQNVICPKSWDVNGGACSIYYWQPQHAIVVRATGRCSWRDLRHARATQSRYPLTCVRS